MSDKDNKKNKSIGNAKTNAENEKNKDTESITNGQIEVKELEKKDQIVKNRKSKTTEYTTDKILPFIQWVEKSDTMIPKIIINRFAQHCKKNIHFKVVRDDVDENEEILVYEKGRYQTKSENDFKGIIKNFYTTDERQIIRDLESSKIQNEVFISLMTDNNVVSRSLFDADENIINFKNGVLHLDTMELKGHDPKYLCTIQLPVSYNPCAKDPTKFLAYLDKLTGDKQEKLLLTECIGLAMSNVINSTKKSLFTVGKGDTGKSVLKNLTMLLLGEKNCSPVSLKTLEARFGLAHVYRKRLVGCNDLGYVTVDELEQFKQLTGNDLLSIEKKNKNNFNYRFTGLLWFGANQMPSFGGDKGEHVYKRIMIIKYENEIPPEEQIQDYEKILLEEEGEGIVLLALKALKKFIANGKQFDIPDSCNQSMKEYMVDNEPVLQFIEDCTKPVTDDKETILNKRSTVYKAYKRYCEVNEFKKRSSKSFNNMLNLNKIGENKKTNGEFVFTQFILTESAKYQYLSIPCEKVEIDDNKNPFNKKD